MSLYLEDALSAAALLMSAVMLIVACLSYSRTRHRSVVLPAAVAAAVLAASLAQSALSFGSDAPPEPYVLLTAVIETAAIVAIYTIWLVRARGVE